jgi:hypothetical protein
MAGEGGRRKAEEKGILQLSTHHASPDGAAERTFRVALTIGNSFYTDERIGSIEDAFTIAATASASERCSVGPLQDEV